MKFRGIKKCLYWRNTNVLANDDNRLASGMIPVEEIRGFAGLDSDSWAILFFNQPHQAIAPDGLNAANVLLGTSDQTALAQALVDEILFGENALIVLGDDVTSDYFTGVTSILGATISTV